MSTPRGHAVLAALAALAALTARPAGAQATSAPGAAAAPAATNPATLLVGARLLTGVQAYELGTLPGEGWDQRPVRRDDGTVAVGACVVDPAAEEWLVRAGDRLRLVHRTRGTRWERPLAELGSLSLLPSALLHRDTVVLPRTAGGLVALSRASGADAWEVASAGQTLLVDGELIVAHDVGRRAGAGGDAEAPRLRAFSARNGARAFDVEVPVRAVQVRAAPHGIALVSSVLLVVLDRGGPELFRRELPAMDVAAHAQGWYVLTHDAVLALDRSGRDVWRQPLSPPVPGLQDHRITSDVAGHAIVTSFADLADAGAFVVCRAAADGAEVWHAQLDGLGIGHSKYWHDVRTFARGDALAIVSHGAGGQWVELVDAANGEKRTRHVFTR